MNNKLVKVEEKFIEISKVETINIIGDPGCDGLGAATMSIFAKALTGVKSDFSIIVGDLVPYGSRKFYENVKLFVNNIASIPVYSLCGNHDTDYYNEFFGFKDYCLYNDEISIILLDNSKRLFSEDTIDFCRIALEKNKSENIIILFHIPPPNSFTGNSVSQENWLKLKEIFTPYKEKLKYLVCGHVHSYFEDTVDGIPLIVTGGGGARIEYVSEKVAKENIKNHIVQFGFNKNRELFHTYINIDHCNYDIETKDTQLQNYLKNSFENEATAHFKYKLMSEIAEERNSPNLAKLFSALSSSEYFHAKNHFAVMGRFNGLRKNIKDSINNEMYEINEMYNSYLEYSQNNSYGLSGYTFYDALEAEKIHKPLLEEALLSYLDNKDIPDQNYYICSSCGYTFSKKMKPDRCPVCGAPQDKINSV